MNIHYSTHTKSIVETRSFHVFFFICLLMCGKINALASTITAPDIKLIDVNVVSINLSGANVIIDLMVNNPNTSDIVVEKIYYQLHLNQIKVKNGVIDQEERFIAKIKRPVQVPVFLAFDENLPKILSVLNNPLSSTYVISGSVKLKDNNKTMPFHHEGKLGSF